jgi:hypothetical protein
MHCTVAKCEGSLSLHIAGGRTVKTLKLLQQNTSQAEIHEEKIKLQENHSMTETGKVTNQRDTNIAIIVKKKTENSRNKEIKG